ncbi:MAG: hypothetical protein ACQEWI_02130 [Bacillota bacterium]
MSPYPDLQPIIEEEVHRCIQAHQEYWCQAYANDSGKLILLSLHREKRFIQAVLKVKGQKRAGLKRKLTAFLDSKIVMNYIDNMAFLGMNMKLKEAEEIKMTKEEAFEKLKGFMELPPLVAEKRLLTMQ